MNTSSTLHSIVVTSVGALVLGFLVLVPIRTASAQDQTTSTPRIELLGSSAFALTLDEATELDSINEQSTVATALYLTSAGSLLGAIATSVLGVVVAVGIDSTGGVVLLLTGAGLGVVSIVTLPIAIGFDIDSGSRRGALTERVRIRAEVGLMTATLSGTF